MVHFVKAYGLGNDFVMMMQNDSTNLGVLSQKISNRRYGIGCDQVIMIYDVNKESASIRFFNPDGSEAEACGNGTRCVAKWLLQKNKQDHITLKTRGGLLQCRVRNDHIEADFPTPQLEQNIFCPEIHGYCDAVYVGNPHLICFTDRPEELETLAPEMEYHPHFPNRTNVGFVSVLSKSHMTLHVWERGAGITPACGTGATATAFAAFKRGLVDNYVTVHQKGGDLNITMHLDFVSVCGEAHLVFEGDIDLDRL